MSTEEKIDRRKQIQEAAIRVFAQKGYAGSSNGDIAREAGLKSAALIYHYFPSKLELLRSIVSEYSPAGQLESRKQLLYMQPPEVGLYAIGKAFFHQVTLPEARPITRIVLGEALRSEEFSKSFAAFGPMRMLNVVAGYMEILMEKGHIKKMDPVAAARSFMGPFIATMFLQVIWTHETESIGDHQALIRQYVDTFLNGARAK